MYVTFYLEATQDHNISILIRAFHHKQSDNKALSVKKQTCPLKNVDPAHIEGAIKVYNQIKLHLLHITTFQGFLYYG